MWLLTVEDYEGGTAHHALAGTCCTLGRASDCDVLLAQYNVSRRHARLECVDGGWVLFDEGSDNGSYHNGRRVTGPTPVAEGDLVQVGDYVLRVTRAGAVVEALAPRPAMPARLRVLAGPPAGAEYTFRRSDLVTIGSGDDCSLRVAHERVEPVHAIVRALPGGRYEITDKSRDGSLFVNGRPVVTELPLEGGDAINVAGVALVRYLEPNQPPDPRFDGVLGEDARVPPPPPGPASRRRPVVPGGGLAPVGPPWSSAPPGADADVGTSVFNRVPDVGGEWDVTGLFRNVIVLPGGQVTSADGGEAAGEPLLPAHRFEAVGPLPLPATRALPASYLRLRQTTPGRAAEGRGRGQAAAVVRRALEQADEGLAELQRWQCTPRHVSRPPAEEAPPPTQPSVAPALPAAARTDRPPPGESFALDAPVAPDAPDAAAGGRPRTAPVLSEPSPSLRSLAAFEAPSTASTAGAADGAPPDVAPRASETPASSRRPADAFGRGRAAVTFVACVLAASAAAALTVRARSPEGEGTLVRSAAPALPSDERPSPSPSPTAPEGGGPPAALAPDASEAAAPELRSAAAREPAGATAPPDARGAAPAGERRRGRAPAPARAAAGVEAEASADRGARPAEASSPQRARLEARARAGKASADELRMLLGICQREGDTRCILDISTRLRRAERGP
jgi:pSer/pThr/pTyr-binding forkhead associated (FHA) protein